MNTNTGEILPVHERGPECDHGKWDEERLGPRPPAKPEPKALTAAEIADMAREQLKGGGNRLPDVVLLTDEEAVMLVALDRIGRRAWAAENKDMLIARMANS